MIGNICIIESGYEILSALGTSDTCIWKVLFTTESTYHVSILLQAPQSQESALLDLLGGSSEPSATPVALAAAPASSGGGALLDLLNLDIQQPTPAQPSTGVGSDLGAGLLDLLGAPTSAPAAGLYCVYTSANIMCWLRGCFFGVGAAHMLPVVYMTL